MRTEEHFDVYDDKNKSEDDDDDLSSDDDDDVGYDSLDETTLGNTITVNGESFSIGTYEDDGIGYSTDAETKD